VSNREFFAQLCAQEYPKFLAVLEATPGDRLDYRPHERSRSAHQLVAHLIGHELDLVELAETGDIHHRLEVPFTRIEEAVQIYREAHEALQATLGGLDEAAWNATGKFMLQEHVLMEMPRQGLAWMLMLDAIHHRGQLSVYLRPMGGKVPGIYGPSADTMTAGV
jgi:uncharacterized damage-inducible protein DinB